MDDPPPGRARRAAAAACGLVAATLALLVTVVGGSAEPGYSHMAQYISELGATGAAHASLVAVGGFAPIGALVLAFLGLASAVFPPSWQKTVGTACLAAIGAAYLVSAVCPCDPGCPTSGSFTQSVHNLAGYLEYIGAVAGLLLLAAALRRGQAWRPLALASVAAAGCVAAAVVAMQVPGFGSLRGLCQRVAETALFSWMAYASILLLRIVPETAAAARRQ